jgi:hypothetical protein
MTDKFVWVGLSCIYDGGMSVQKDIEKVFDDEVKALLWVEDKEFLELYDNDYYWREYELFIVE